MNNNKNHIRIKLIRKMKQDIIKLIININLYKKLIKISFKGERNG